MKTRTQAQDRWLLFFNQVVYNTYPALYNLVDRLSLGVWWRLIRRALDFISPDDRILEVGFGPGRLLVELIRKSELCVGLDLAWGMCRFTQRRLHRAGLTSQLVQGSVYNLPYPGGAFDIVVSTFTISGLPDGRRVLQEMARVTARGGSILLIDIGLPADGNWWGVWLAHLWERMGDCLYDLPEFMELAGLIVTVFEEYGPGNHIHLIAGVKP